MHGVNILHSVSGSLLKEIGLPETIFGVAIGFKNAKVAEKELLAQVAQSQNLRDFLTLDFFKGLDDLLKKYVQYGIVEASRMQKVGLSTFTCNGCGGPAAVHDKICVWCGSGLPLD